MSRDREVEGAGAEPPADETTSRLQPLPLALGPRGPWTVVETREVYRNAWVRVREDQVLRPNGTPGIYGVIECGLAVGVVPLGDDGRVHLVGQYRYPTGEYSWEVPTGTADRSESGGRSDVVESPLAAAKRELEEETGLRAAQWTWLGRVQVSNSVTDQVGVLYLAEGLTAGEARPDETEELAVHAVPFADAVTMAVSGEVSDAFSALALLRAWYVRGAQQPSSRSHRDETPPSSPH
jgi:8-oxo-dGTP pyrophosphatase MutT (NUDIX family)